MNKRRKSKILPSTSINNEESYISPKIETTKHKMLTSCRRIGLNRKRKNTVVSPTSSEDNSSNNKLNIVTNQTKSEIVSSVSSSDNIQNNVSNKVFSPVAEKSVIKNKIGLKSRKRSYNDVESDKISLHKDSTKTEFLNNEQNKSILITPVSVVLTRCDSDLINLQNLNSSLKENKTKLETSQNLSTTKDADSEDSNYSLNKNSPNILSNEDSSPVIKETNETMKKDKNFNKIQLSNKISTENLNETKTDTIKSQESSEKDLLADSDEMSDFDVSSTRRKKKKSLSTFKKSPKPSTSKQKENISQTIVSKSNTPFNSDSDDDFVEKPRREKKIIEHKKKINLIQSDPLNRTEHIRIAENKSYTIMHKGNVSSYIKWYDNDNLKITESDDNQQTSSQQTNTSNARESMIIERKDYLVRELEEKNESMFDFILENIEKYKPDPNSDNFNKSLQIQMKNLLDLKASIISRLKVKREKLDSLKRITVYKEEHNLEQLKATTLQIKRALQEALVDLLYHLKKQTEGNFSMTSLLGFCNIPYELIGYNEEEDRFE